MGLHSFQQELSAVRRTYLLGLCKLNFGRSFTALRIGIGSCVFSVFMYMFSLNYLLLMSKKKVRQILSFQTFIRNPAKPEYSPAPEHLN